MHSFIEISHRLYKDNNNTHTTLKNKKKQMSDIIL